MKIRVVLYIDIIINIKFYLNSIFHKKYSLRISIAFIRISLRKHRNLSLTSLR